MKKIIECLNNKNETYKVINNNYILLNEGYVKYNNINKIYDVLILEDEKYTETDINEVIEILLSY